MVGSSQSNRIDLTLMPEKPVRIGTIISIAIPNLLSILMVFMLFLLIVIHQFSPATSEQTTTEVLMFWFFFESSKWQIWSQLSNEQIEIMRFVVSYWPLAASRLIALCSCLVFCFFFLTNTI